MLLGTPAEKMKPKIKLHLMIFFLASLLWSGISRASSYPEPVLHFLSIQEPGSYSFDEFTAGVIDEGNFHNLSNCFKCSKAGRICKSEIRIQNLQLLVSNSAVGAKMQYATFAESMLRSWVLSNRPFYYTFLFRLTPF